MAQNRFDSVNLDKVLRDMASSEKSFRHVRVRKGCFSESAPSDGRKISFVRARRLLTAVLPHQRFPRDKYANCKQNFGESPSPSTMALAGKSS